MVANRNALLFYIVFVFLLLLNITVNDLFLYARIEKEVANRRNSAPNLHSEIDQMMINNHLPSCLAMQFKFMVKMC